ncbi:mRNA turnover and ribosome assembly protein [Coelomomyces lativittatus]|nr:mRNA turnover and ribosome assembly protein [Coelomomyces lativittatus]KAJ1517206.1 mRNA turnover and ribosome assembly protein [Coelomomyces lativittatus]KAJ1518325.1 mRNA turnover and ribosome assembly protein [Coelomomyces lativittatus]
MPKSKRQKVISLTKTIKKGKQFKQERFEKIKNACLNHRYTYLFVPHTMRNKEFKRLYECLKDTMVCMGKTKLMTKALTSLKLEGMDALTEQLHGMVGLMFSHEPPNDLKAQLDQWVGPVYARSGTKASQTVCLPAGLLRRNEETLPGALEPMLRKLGLPTSLTQGQVMLNSPYTICNKGDMLTPNQAHLLKHFYIQLGEFRVQLKCYYDTQLNEFHEI